MADDTERVESADDAEIADQKPKKKCEWTESYGRGKCGETAVKAVWKRVDSRVNEHGVFIATKVRPVWVCEDHASRGQDVPDAEAEVVTHR
ncbi:hypothetical protein [Halosimplex marinum]|uniref:hypothetical protein n=1 Tax=Halosimplex marinum TaxID=3396620 RepID=UPI003F546A8C